MVGRFAGCCGSAVSRHAARDAGRLLRCGISAGLMPASGQLHTLPRRSIAVRFTPTSRPQQDGLNAALCAKSRHMQCSRTGNHLLGDGELHGRNSLAVINLPAAKRRYEFSSSNVDCHATLPWGSCPCNRGTISRLNRPVCDDFTFGGRARRRPRRDRHYCPTGARHNGHSLRNYGALPSARGKRAEGPANYCFGFAAVVDGLIEPQGSLDTVVLGRVFLVTSL